MDNAEKERRRVRRRDSRWQAVRLASGGRSEVGGVAAAGRGMVVAPESDVARDDIELDL